MQFQGKAFLLFVNELIFRHFSFRLPPSSCCSDCSTFSVVSQSGARETSARSAPTNLESQTGNTTGEESEFLTSLLVMPVSTLESVSLFVFVPADTVAVYCATSVPARRCPSSNSTSLNRSGCAKLVPMCSLSGYPPHKIKPSTQSK